jgi:hypothetical protein
MYTRVIKKGAPSSNRVCVFLFVHVYIYERVEGEIERWGLCCFVFPFPSHITQVYTYM